MKNSVASNNVDELSVLGDLEHFSASVATLQEAPIRASQVPVTPVPTTRSYQPYAWGFLNNLLDIVEAKLPGRAGQVQRVVSYLFFGGTAALVNLLAFAIMLRLLSGDNVLQNTFAYIVAAELSIIANFVPNDRFTFNTLPGAQRPWLQRCLRFHATCIVGTVLTYLIETLLKFQAHIPALVAEAIAIIIVLIYNFTFHHIFTYRHTAKARV